MKRAAIGRLLFPLQFGLVDQVLLSSLPVFTDSLI
jgi:hypothetical protein